MNVAAEILKSFKPPPILTVSDWSDKNRQLSAESSAEPGRWITARAEYQRGIMDAATDPDVEIIVLMSSSQVGKTEIINNIIGYAIHNDPGPMMVLQPNVKPMAETYSKDRLTPMIRDTKVLTGLVKSPKSRDSNNTILHKVFPGGHITLAGANSPASLASRPIRYLLADEVDRYPASSGKEGDPVGLAQKRTTTFWNRLIVLTSTPTIKGFSRIEEAFLATDQRLFFVPCPDCGHYQILRWSNVVWLKDTDGNNLFESAVYACDKCGVEWKDGKRWNAIRKGEWRPTAKPQISRARGFHLNEIYSPWVRLADMVEKWIDAQGNQEKIKVFVNTSLGESWEDYGRKVEHSELYERREKYPAIVPAGATVLTMGVDVQDDRLEYEIVGWGKGFESWSVDYGVIFGRPSSEAVWRDLLNVITAQYRHEYKINLVISATCIDSGGHFTDQVYRFVKNKEAMRIFAIKGANTPGKPLISRPSKRNRYNINLFTVGTDTAKETIYTRLSMIEPGAGYMHFPLKYDEEYFKQLTAERMTTKYTRGFQQRVWVKDASARNEVLDCRIYAMAALGILNPNFDKIAESFMSRVEEAKEKSEAEQKAVMVRKRNNRGWVNAWKK